jgi:hypothetical protein
VNTQRPTPSDDEHRVLIFRPRSALASPGGQRVEHGQLARRREVEPEPPEPNDLSRYEHDRDEAGDFRHRMLANLAALAFTIALTAVALWLAASIANLRKTQDCVAMGRRDCATIFVPHN